MTTVYVIVPVLNEAANLPRLFSDFGNLSAALKGQHVFSETPHLQIILVDDGSADDTAQLAQKLATEHGLSAKILMHEVNHGPGYAFGTAFKYLADILLPDDWVITMEGDNTSRQDLIGRMFYRTLEGYEVVFASAYMYGGGVVNTSSYRIFLSNMANTFVKEFLGIHGIMTVSSFFRLHKGNVIQDLQEHYGARIIERRGFECMIEMTIKLIYRQATISEVPMILDTQLREGKSKMKVFRTVRGYLTLLRKMPRWRKGRKLPIDPNIRQV